ncbi:EpsG family protein [Alcanivorax marinus]|nr:EpsG family protein [Alloalcanivorax marinus]MBM7333642.1 EpsG family protein [Alloalcanivorax marinus]
MFPYWFAFVLPIFGSIFGRRLDSQSGNFFWVVWGLIYTLFVGLRYRVGADWSAYNDHLIRVSTESLWDVVTGGDPGYYILNWLVVRLGGEIYLVNFVCAAIVMWGVVSFSRKQPLPWLSLLISVPYLIIVVSMGYTRQSVALGLLLVGLSALSERSIPKFTLWVLVAAAFHKSAVLMLPMAALSSTEKKGWSMFWVAVIAAGAGYFFLSDHVSRLWSTYVVSDYESEGGLIRVLMNAVPAVVFLIFRRKFAVSAQEAKLWTWMSIFAISCLPLVLIASAATDRVALYLIPLQLYVFSRLHRVADQKLGKALIVVLVIGYYALVQFVWLNFASHSDAWLPYQTVWAAD